MDNSNLPSKPLKTPPRISFEGSDYAHIKPGNYQAIATSTFGPEWVRSFSRWKVRVGFTLLDDPSVCIFRFFNLGDQPQHEKPSVGFKTDYWAWWTAANDGPPDRGEALLPDVFMNGQIFTVTVNDAKAQPPKRKKGADGKPLVPAQYVKASPRPPYSVISELESVTFASRQVDKSTETDAVLKVFKRLSVKVGKPKSTQADKPPLQGGI